MLISNVKNVGKILSVDWLSCEFRFLLCKIRSYRRFLLRLLFFRLIWCWFVDLAIQFEWNWGFALLLGHSFAISVTKSSQIDYFCSVLDRFKLAEIFLFINLFLLFFIRLSYCYLTFCILNFIEKATDNFFDLFNFLTVFRHIHISKSFNFGFLWSWNIETWNILV